VKQNSYSPHNSEIVSHNSIDYEIVVARGRHLASLLSFVMVRVINLYRLLVPAIFPRPILRTFVPPPH
jgi:hypothetical protein